MSQQVRVERDLLFRGAAFYQPNVKGPIMSELKIFDETFFADAEELDWAEFTAGTTIDHSAVDGGATTITGDNTATNDCGELSHTAQWGAYSNCGLEAKIKISQIEDIGLAIGFVDVRTGANDRIVMEFDGTALKNNTTTLDFAGFMFDTGGSGADVWYVVASKAGDEGGLAAAAGTLAPEPDTYFRVRLQTDTAGNVTFYYNGVPVGYLPTAIAFTSTDLLTPYVGTIQRVKGAQVTTISRITVWQDCS